MIDIIFWSFVIRMWSFFPHSAFIIRHFFATGFGWVSPYARTVRA